MKAGQWAPERGSGQGWCAWKYVASKGVGGRCACVWLPAHLPYSSVLYTRECSVPSSALQCRVSTMHLSDTYTNTNTLPYCVSTCRRRHHQDTRASEPPRALIEMGMGMPRVVFLRSSHRRERVVTCRWKVGCST
jgi:hypothetical protein